MDSLTGIADRDVRARVYIGQASRPRRTTGF